MADTKNTSGAAAAPAFDWQKFTASNPDTKGEGAKLVKTGQLYPIYSWERAAAESWPPAYGQLLGIEVLPEIDGPEGKRKPLMYRMMLKIASKGEVGTGDDAKETVDVPAGGIVIVPINGIISANTQMHMAALDQKVVYTAGFRLTGETKKLKGRPTPMNVVEMVLLPESVTRTAATTMLQSKDPVIAQELFLDYGRPVPNALREDYTANGAVYDTQTGEIKRMGNSAQA